LANTAVWSASGSGNWDSANNWSPKAVPNNTGLLVTLAYGTTISAYTFSILAAEIYGIGSLKLGAIGTTSPDITLNNAGSFYVSTGPIALYRGTEFYSGGGITDDGGLVDYGTLVANSNLYIANSGTVEAAGLLQIGQSGRADVQTNVYDYGQVTVQGQFTDPADVYGNGKFLVDGGTVSANGSGSFLNIGSSSIGFTIENGSSLSVTNAGNTGNSFVFGVVMTRDNVLTMPSYSGTVKTTITSFGPGDVINVGSGGSNWIYSITPNGGGTYTLSYGAPYNEVTFTNVTLAPGVTASDIEFQKGTIICACFARGTCISTPDGAAEVEALQVGDSVTTLSGEMSVRWVGRQLIDLAAHPRPKMVAPVRIRRGAFGDAMPHRDLLVSPDHAILVDDMLICARQLINGTTIAQEQSVASIEYFHVELEQHDILLAEGLPAESYLATANRGFFENSDGPLLLRPDLVEADPAARDGASHYPFVSTAAQVKPVWQRLADRAAAQSPRWPSPAVTRDPALCIDMAGTVLRPIYDKDGLLIFVLRRGSAEVRLLSRAAAPTDLQPWLDDRRYLGVDVRRITVRDSTDLVDVPLDGPALDEGWWDVEQSGTVMHRWTDGAALLHLPQIRGVAALLELRIGNDLSYPLASAQIEGRDTGSMNGSDSVSFALQDRLRPVGHGTRVTSDFPRPFSERAHHDQRPTQGAPDPSETAQ
jgi:hypothetical protein